MLDNPDIEINVGVTLTKSEWDMLAIYYMTDRFPEDLYCGFMFDKLPRDSFDDKTRFPHKLTRKLSNLGFLDDECGNLPDYEITAIGKSYARAYITQTLEEKGEYYISFNRLKVWAEQ